APAQAGHAGGRVRQGVREAGHGARAQLADHSAARGEEVTRRVKRIAVLVAALAVAAGATVYAQRRATGFGPPQVALIAPNTKYDGRFTFVRLRYGPPVTYASQRVFLSHDYPTVALNSMSIMNDLTYLVPPIYDTNTI